MVSVIVPVYNSSEFLFKSVYSIFSHGVVSEIILIDDGSSDNSLDLCYQLRKEDSRVRVLTHSNGENRGAGESRNLGIQNSCFPYISFLDSDDIYYENRFDESLEILQSNPLVMGCYGKVLVNYLNLDYKKLMGVPVGLNPNNLFGHILNGGYFHTNSLTVRKSFLDRVGGFNQSCWPHEDVEFWTRLTYYGNLLSISSDLPIAEYRIHGKNLSQIGNWKSRCTLWSKIFENFFLKSISFKERFLILKQLSKSLLSLFKA